MRDVLFSRSGILVAIAVAYLLIFILIYPAGIESGDAGIKHTQVEDIILNDYKSIGCYYPFKEYDPHYTFFPLRNTFFVHIVNGECYYVFPFYLTLLLLPFRFVFGITGEYLVPLASGLGILLTVFSWSRRMNAGHARLLLLFVGIGSYTALFSFALGETSFVTFLITTSFYLITAGNFKGPAGEKGPESGSVMQYILAGFLTGFACWFRQEILMLGGLLILSGILFSKENGRARIGGFILSFAISIGTLAAINYHMFSNPLGLRAIQQQTETGNFFLGRMEMFLEMFFYGRGNVGLLLSYPMLGLLLFRVSDLREMGAGMKSVFLSALGFILLLPLFTVTFQGVGWGTRFYFPLIPALLYLFFHVMERDESIFKNRKIGGVVYTNLGYAFIAILISLATLKYVNTETLAINRTLESKTGEIIIYQNPGLVNAGLSTHKNRIHLAYYKVEDFITLLKLVKKAGYSEADLVASSYRGGVQNYELPSGWERFASTKTVQDDGKLKISRIIIK